MNMSETRKPTQMGINGVFEDIIVDAENALYDGTGAGGGDNVKSALNNLKSRVSSLEQGGSSGGGGSSSDKIAYLESLVEQRTLNVEYEEGGNGWRTHGHAVGTTYTGDEFVNDGYNPQVRASIAVTKGDIITIWGQTNGYCGLYLLVDGDNIIIEKAPDGSSKVVTEESPTIVNVSADGILYINSKAVSGTYGAIRSYKGVALATPLKDGMMSAAQVSALMQVNPYVNKEIAVMGDSFTTGNGPATWFFQMCALLGAKVGKNVAIDGGRWIQSSESGRWAYEQAQALVTYYQGLNTAPDYVLICLGTNDINNNPSYGTLVNSSTIGSAGTTNPSEIDPATVIGSMQATYITLKTAFPNAIIKCGYTPAGYIHDDFNKIDNVETLCQTMRKVGLAYGVGYVETRACGIAPYWSGDSGFYGGGHPSANGNTRIAQYMARILMSNQ